MFLRKLFKLENKFTWVLIDLVIVIIGVYSAFLIQNYSVTQSNNKEREKVLTALKYELETFRIQFPEFAEYMDDYHEKVKNVPDTDFSGWRYIEPQYAYQIIEYAMNVQNGDIVDFNLYDDLQKLYVLIKQLEHVERLLTEISGRYKKGIPTLAADHPLNLDRQADNASEFSRFLLFVRSRSQSLNRISDASTEALVLINDLLGPEKVKTIEIKIIATNSQIAEDEDEAVKMVGTLFPSFTEKEVRQLYRDGQKK